MLKLLLLAILSMAVYAYFVGKNTVSSIFWKNIRRCRKC